MAQPEIQIAKGGLAKLLAGELMPNIPPLQNNELEQYLRALENYIRRLMGRFTATNIINTIFEELGITEAAIDWRYDTDTHKFQVMRARFVDGVIEVSDWLDTSGGQPVLTGEITNDVLYDTGDKQFTQDKSSGVYVLEATSTGNELIVELVPCTEP